MVPSAYSEHMEAASVAALAASDVLMARFNAGVENLESWEKSPGALVTEADLESDQAIAPGAKRFWLRRRDHIGREQC